MRILLVEDDDSMAASVAQGLTEAGYAVDVVHDGRDGRDYAVATPYDLFIFDIMLPGLDGLRLLAGLRQREIKTPTLMLTARDTVTNRVEGLDAGADDYLVKPFAFPELLARIRALLRRPPLQQAPILKVGDLEMDTARHTVCRKGQIVSLRPKEYAVLEYLMRNPEQVLSRDQIGEHVWNLDFYAESNVVDVYVGYLRRKINREGETSLIHTIRGIGYRISVLDNDA